MQWLFLLLPLILFSKVEIELGGRLLQVEIADTDLLLSKGLQGRTELRENEGMLFIFPRVQILSFWMKDTRIPLTVGYFDKNRVLIETFDMDPPLGKDLPTYVSSSPALYALEVTKGWFAKYQIRPGMKFSFHDRNNAVK